MVMFIEGSVLYSGKHVDGIWALPFSAARRNPHSLISKNEDSK
jgi:hypothetical protein